MARRVFILLWPLVASATSIMADEHQPPLRDKPQWQRMLQGDDAVRAAKLQEQFDAALAGERYVEAARFGEEIVSLRARIQGDSHWETVAAKNMVEHLTKMAKATSEEREGWKRAYQGASRAAILEGKGQFVEALPLREEYHRWCKRTLGERSAFTADSYRALAYHFDIRGQYVQAQSLYQRALDLWMAALGPLHPTTAWGYNYAANNLNSQGKYRDAEPLYQKSLQIRVDAFGDKHPDVATGYNSVARNRAAQGKYAEACVFFQKALELRTELEGERSPNAANSYNGLAIALEGQGGFAAAQPLHEKALDIIRDSLGEQHPFTANCYKSLAVNLIEQGKYALALPLLQKALELRIQMFGEQHPDSATSCGDLGTALGGVGRYVDAELLHRKSLELYVRCLGDYHPYIAVAYANLAGSIDAQGSYTDAEVLYRKALDLRLAVLGEMHSDIADSYNSLAFNLDRQGRYDEAQPLFSKALEMRLALHGDKHPAIANSYNNLAGSLDSQGKFAAAQGFYQKAILLCRELLGEKHPNTALCYANYASSLIREEKFTEAHRMLSNAAISYEAARLRRAVHGLERAAFGAEQSPYPLLAATNATLTCWEAAWRAAENDLARGLADESAARSHSQQITDETNAQSNLSRELNELDARCLALVVKQSPSDDEKAELARLHAERDKLDGELAEMAVLVSQREVAPLTEIQAVLPQNSALVQWIDVADGALQQHWGCVLRRGDVPRWEELPGAGQEGKWTSEDGGLHTRLSEAISGNASETTISTTAQRLYAQRIAPLEKHLGGVVRLLVVPVGAMAGVPVDVLTDRYLVSYVSSGTFLARLNKRPTPSGASLLALGDPVLPTINPPKALPVPPELSVHQMLSALNRGGGWAELPGTAAEVARLTALADHDETTVLTRSAANEQHLEALRATGKLAQFRYLHFATHGEPNNARSFESALILSQDQITGDIPVGGGKYYDGRLTANEVLENWKLNADLVTLSACESALGRPGGGDGPLGFAQAFLLAGARSVCLSLWKVDDTATALLMGRFYENLLGKRVGLAEPMPKAEALADAKRWLRELTRDEATRLAAEMTGGVARGKGEDAIELVVPKADAATAKPDDRPFAHPRDWAAFILIGDPN
jgi:CHAT domain-containing protein/Flp pilus assembly protein TadD